MNLPKMVTYKCAHCGLVKDETLMDGYPSRIAPKKPTCKLCASKSRSVSVARARWRKKGCMTKISGRTKRTYPTALAPNGNSIQNPVLHRSYSTDTYLADGRFNASMFRKGS